LTELAARHHLAESFTPDDAAGICECLARKLREFREGRYSLSSGAVGIERFDRRQIAGEFAAVFRDAVRRARDSGPPR
jgi:hypothetical protein